MPFDIKDIINIIERFNEIESTRDENLVLLEQYNYVNRSLGETKCNLFYHKLQDVYLLASSRDNKLYVNPAFCRYGMDSWLNKRDYKHRVLNNRAMGEFIESKKYDKLEDYILSADVYDCYRNLLDTIYKFRGDVDNFYKTDEKINPTENTLEFIEGEGQMKITKDY